MSKAKTVQQKITQIEYELAKHTAVAAAFPDAKANSSGFYSKEVNAKYTHYTFERFSSGLYVIPYCEVEVNFNGKSEFIKVLSSPRMSRLVYLSWMRRNNKRVMKFARLTINMKNNNFKEDMLNSCKTEIMTFIKQNPDHELDQKHLDPRLKKLLMFT